jgi:hypothetical protein
LLTIIAGVLPLLPERTSGEAICRELRLKPLRYVSGTVINPLE